MGSCWSTSLKTAPASEPLSLEEAKLHLRLSTDATAEDDLVASLIVAAREHVETYTNRALITQTWYWKSGGFPYWREPIVIPRPPLASITAISYVDMNGVTQTWAASSTGYQLIKPAGPKAQYASVLPAYMAYYPPTRQQPEAVTIEYVCGYGDSTAVPDSIKSAMRLLIGHWYENRESVIVGETSAEMPSAVPALLGGYTVERF